MTVGSGLTSGGADGPLAPCINQHSSWPPHTKTLGVTIHLRAPTIETEEHAYWPISALRVPPSAASLIVDKLFSSNYPGGTTVATVLFLVLWLVIAAANMWVGVAKAGYSVAAELPIFALIFAVPAAVAILVRWKFL